MNTILLAFGLCVCLCLYCSAVNIVETSVSADSSQVLSPAPYRLNTEYRAEPHPAVRPLDARYKSETSMSVKMRYSFALYQPVI